MSDKIKIGVLGAGTWGIALSRMLSNAGYNVTVWSAIEKEIDILEPNKSKGGTRRYIQKDIDLLQQIKFLIEEQHLTGMLKLNLLTTGINVMLDISMI